MHKTIMKPTIITFITMLLVLTSSFIIAKTKNDKDYYQVELIIFKYNSQEQLTNENWPLMELQVPQNVIKITNQDRPGNDRYNDDFESSEFSSKTNRKNSQYYKILDNKELLQQSIAYKIEHNSRYKIISHLGFRIPKKDVQKTQPLYFETGKVHQVISVNNQNDTTNNIEGFNDDNTIELETSEISGILRLQQKKFVHSELELLFTHPALITNSTKKPFELVNDTDTIRLNNQQNNKDYGYNDNEYNNSLYLQSFKLSEKRRLKYNELNYFDHPIFGAIVSIS